MSKERSFLLATGFASAASVIIPIEMAAIATEVGDSHGGKYAGLMFAVVSVATAISTPFVPMWVQRWGCSPLLRNAMFIRGVLFIGIGLAAVFSAADYPLILVASPLIGTLIAIRMTCGPLLGRVILSPDSPVMWSRRQLFRAPAAAIGAAVGGFLASSEVVAGIGLILGGVLTLPLGFVAASTDVPEGPHAAPHPRRFLAADLKAGWQQTSTRVGFCVAVICSFVLTPMHSMILPVVAELDHGELWRGVGLVLASLQLGSMGTKFVVDRWRTAPNNPNCRIAVVAMTISGALVLSLAGSALWLAGYAELAAWIVLAAGIALFRGVVTAAQVGVFLDDGCQTNDASGAAALHLVRTVSTTVALLVWGVTLDAGGAEFLLAGAGFLAIAAGAVLLPLSRRQNGRITR